MLDHFSPYKNVLKPGVLLPKIKIDQRFYDELNLPNSTTNYDFLRQLCWKGIKEKGIDKLPNAKDYYSRVKRELETFNELLFVEYILLNWEIHNFCHESKILTGWGRGSAASSLVLYLLNVTRLDPLEHDLYFERFLSADRAKKIEDGGEVYLDGGSLCDIDSDISHDDRHKVIEFINCKHNGRTAKILTLLELSTKIVIKECAKIVCGMTEEEANYISSFVPKAFNIPLPLTKSLAESERLRDEEKRNPRLFAVAKKLEGLIKTTGIHASGIAICNEDIENIMPVQYSKDKETGEEGVSTGFEMNDVSALAVKFDILGLKTLSIVDKTCELAGVELSKIPKSDDDAYKFLSNLFAPYGLFQIETDVGFNVCKKVRPRHLDDLAAIISLARPGALAYVDRYAKFVQTGESQSVNPFFDDVLAKTGLLPLFQENLMALIVKIGFSGRDADKVRKCVGKKLVKEMGEWKVKIFDKVKEQNLDISIAESLWKIAEESANYAFCLSPETVVQTPDGYVCLAEIKIGDKVLAFDTEKEENHFVNVTNVFEKNAELFEFEFEDGRTVVCSMDHKFLCSDKKMRPIKTILKKNLSIVCNTEYGTT